MHLKEVRPAPVSTAVSGVDSNGLRFGVASGEIRQRLQVLISFLGWRIPGVYKLASRGLEEGVDDVEISLGEEKQPGCSNRRLSSSRSLRGDFNSRQASSPSMRLML